MNYCYCSYSFAHLLSLQFIFRLGQGEVIKGMLLHLIFDRLLIPPQDGMKDLSECRLEGNVS